jgi:hypothetical protein
LFNNFLSQAIWIRVFNAIFPFSSPPFGSFSSPSRNAIPRFVLSFLACLLSALAADFYARERIAFRHRPTAEPVEPADRARPARHRPAGRHHLGAGGTYPGKYRSALRGGVNQPIIVRQYPGERAILDANTNTSTPAVLTADGAWTWFWGLEVTNSNPVRRLGSSRPGRH